MQELYYRIVKGEELTDLELDDNFKRLRAAINSLEAQIASISSGGNLPVGTVLIYTGSTLPSGYLWANGSAISRTTYADLFAVNGITYGAGDGVSTFNVIRLNGRFPMGANPMGGVTDGTLSNRVIGTYLGVESITMTHTHTASGTVTINAVNVTPTGTVLVNPYVGSAPITISVTVNSVTLSTTPSGTVTIVNASPTTTPSGTVTVDPHVNHTHEVTTTPFFTNEHLEGTEVALHDTYTTSNETPTLTHNAVFVGDLATLTHSHGASFAGALADLSHTHTATATAPNVSLNHTHTAAFSGSLMTFTPTGTTAITVNNASPSATIINPTVVCNYIIKY